MSAIRITDVVRGTPIRLTIDGAPVPAFAGETIAAAMLAAGHARFQSGGRGLFCNMGSCCECLVTLVASGRRVRACLAEAVDGLEIATDG